MTHPIDGDMECWQAPQSLFRILYSRPVLEQIRLAVVDAYLLVPLGGVEIGGVLLGKYADRQLEIIDHKPIECDFSQRGGSGHPRPSFPGDVASRPGSAALGFATRASWFLLS